MRVFIRECVSGRKKSEDRDRRKAGKGAGQETIIDSMVGGGCSYEELSRGKETRRAWPLPSRLVDDDGSSHCLSSS